MSYFLSPTAEYRAKRITQKLAHAGQTNVLARRDGKVAVNCDGHMHLFDMDGDRNLVLVDSADLLKPKQEVQLI